MRVSAARSAWKTPWKETRDGYNPNDLPRSYDATIEEYVEMKGITHLMGLFYLQLYPIILEMFGKDCDRRLLWC